MTRTSSPRFVAGRMIGDFEVVELIGRGASGEVYRARQRSLGGREVALKVLQKNSDWPRLQNRLSREALALAELHHPHLAEIYGVGDFDGHLFIAMQIIEGVTLSDVIKSQSITDQSKGSVFESTIDLRAKIGWVADVADALALVHSTGSIHRDVKPANIIIQGQGLSMASQGDSPPRAVLVDFGLACSDAELRAGDVISTSATVGYASPEQLLGGEVTKASDVFSLGVTAYDLVRNTSAHERPAASLGLSTPPGLDRDLSAIFQRALDPLPEWRYADAAEFAKDLKHWLAGEAVSARRATLSERIRRAGRRRAGTILTWATALLLMGLLVGSLLGARRLYQDRRLAHDAVRALQDGDLGLFHEKTSSMSSWIPRGLFIDDSLDSAFEDASDPSTPLGALCGQLALGNQWSAHEIAAIELGRGGPLRAGVFRQYLEHELLELEASLPIGQVGPRESSALLFVMRVLTDHPARDEQEREAWRAVRGSLVRVFESEFANPEQIHSAASALSSCAQPEDVLLLMNWVAATKPGREARRLLIQCTNSAIRNLHQSREASDLPFTALWELLEGELRDLIRTEFELESLGDLSMEERGLEYLSMSLALAERSVTSDTRLHSLVSEAWARPLPGAGVRRKAAIQLAGAAGLIRTVKHLGGLPASGAPEWADAMGFGLGASPGFEGDVVVAGERWLDSLDEDQRTTERLEAFREGFRRAQRELEGNYAHDVFDEESFLDSVPGRTSVVETAFVREAKLQDPLRSGRWFFHEVEPVLDGVAVDLELLDVEHQVLELGDHGLVARRFGRSEIRLGWESRIEDNDAQWTLTLLHAAALRSNLLRGGKCYVEIELDGELLDVELLQNPSWESYELRMPVSEVPPGPHTLVVRLGSLSTTTYRVQRVALRLD